MPDSDKKYMQRCLELARMGLGSVAPNPVVGAVLVHEGRIIGEGYHRRYGQAHAEVNCIDSVSEADKGFIPGSVLYVSLEPCAHFGKTPPCTDLIIRQKIPRVVIGCKDPNKGVSGNGIKRLVDAGIGTETGVLEKECIDLNRRFFTFHLKNRPYIILKWAQSLNGKIAARDSGRSFISNELTNRLVHRWRTEEAAILVGPGTAHADNPVLNGRNWNGPDPVRVVLDRDLSLPPWLHLFDGAIPTIRLNTVKQEAQPNLLYYRMGEEPPLPNRISEALWSLDIQSVLVEGGGRTLQSFIDTELWDEIRVIQNESLVIPEGIPAPELPACLPVASQRINSDLIKYYKA